MLDKQYDVIVVGAGHAGCEAALAASRIGMETLLITINLDNLAQMSCNPAVGGIAKGHLVKEIDALGGEMGKAADFSAIQFRRLNASKGPAVQSSRCQTDRWLYHKYYKQILENQAKIHLYQNMVTRLLVKNHRVYGIKTKSGEIFYGKTVILSPGTFLSGLIHIGLTHYPGGRLGDPSAEEITKNLKTLGFNLGRFKTGTCPRLDARTIDFNRTTLQPGDAVGIPFSFSNRNFPNPQLPCFLTYTNKRTHEIIFSSLDRSPLYTGVIQATGVRYCPSIEDKLVRFADRSQHHVFLEPEGLNTIEYYPNGLSTSLPLDVQLKMLRTIQGLEKVEIIRPGYGIEHYYSDPTQLFPTLETKLVENLYFAGQINGTTGYEEAGAQGVIAGINAALKVKNLSSLVLDRSQAYIGVLLDDLVTKGTNEPYRMFTSRAEYRLLLREDNADLRLREIGYKSGLIDETTFTEFSVKKAKIEQELNRLKDLRITPGGETNQLLEEFCSSPLKGGISLADLLKRPEIRYRDLPKFFPGYQAAEPEIAEQVEIEILYRSFLRRQQEEVEKFKHMEEVKIPMEFDYSRIHGFSNEIKEKLNRIKPLSLGQAARIPGITPAAISALIVNLKKGNKANKPK